MKSKHIKHQYIVQHQPEQSPFVSVTFYESDPTKAHGSLIVGQYDSAKKTFSIECDHWGDFDHSADGESETFYMFDEENTSKLMKLTHQTQPFLFLEALRDTVVTCPSKCVDDIKDFCNAHGVDYDYSVYY